MALRLGLLKCAADSNNRCCKLGLRRWAHAMASPLDGSFQSANVSPSLVLPELEQSPDDNGNNSNLGFGFPGFSFGGSMELMAVPKKKVSPHKRGIRNGPKALKPTPVIIRCRSCGRVKLPHFYCCSGDRGKNSEQGN